MSADLVAKDSRMPVGSQWDTLLLKAFHMEDSCRGMSTFLSCRILLIVWLVFS